MNFGADNSSSQQSKICKNNFSLSVGEHEKKFSINFIKSSLHYHTDNSYVFVNKTQICKFKDLTI